MCFGSKKSSAPPPAPAPVATTAVNALPDTSNVDRSPQQKIASTLAPQSSAFGSELGTSTSTAGAY
jgi:hypothetical protein